MMSSNRAIAALWAAIVCYAALSTWALAEIERLNKRLEEPVALCPNYDTVYVTHRLSSSGYNDSTPHRHVYVVNLDTIPACLHQLADTLK